MAKPPNHSFMNGFQSMEIPKKKEDSPWNFPPAPTDTSLFSTSLPVLRHSNFTSVDTRNGNRNVDGTFSNSNKFHTDVKDKVPHDGLDLQGIGNLLPGDEDDLLAGLADDFDLSGLPTQLEELEDDDVFDSGGGLELDADSTDSLTFRMERANISDGYIGNGTAQYSLPNGVGSVSGEHPYGEHPSRTLFVRNINSNVEDSELRAHFEQYGDIRTLYTACKHRGFVMISYYDIRDARNAMRALQNKPLRRRKLDIHFSIPKDNPSEKDSNQGTLVVFNLDPSVSNDDLRQIFGTYGEVKEIRETPHKRHHKFIEFYDVRAAEAALRALNRSDIAGKRIKLEPSRPGGSRRNLMQQLNQELEQDEPRSFRHPVGSPIAGSPPGIWAQFSSPGDSSPLQALSQSPTRGATVDPMTGSTLPGLASILPPLSNSIKIPSVGKDHGRMAYMDRAFLSSNSPHAHSSLHSHSLPDHSSGILLNMNSPGSASPFGHTGTGTSAVSTLSGPQFLWGSPLYQEHSRSQSWQRQSLGHSFTPNGQGQGFLYPNRHNSFITPPQSYSGHNVGSAPSGIPLERHFGYFSETPDTSFTNHNGFGGMSVHRNDGSLMMNMNIRSTISGGGLSGNLPENGTSAYRMIPSPRMGHMFVGGSPYYGLGSNGVDGLFKRGRNHLENNGSQVDSKKQYQLELDKIRSGEDNRTTLMIKNIPNKYTSKMLLAAIDESHKGTYDFLYLPIDFKNKCNVGYAFINMVSASHIIPFYEAFNGKKWEKFNSEKVASLAYARIQGKVALVSHFQNSSLMNEDKRCRPILFHSEGPDAGDQEPFPLGSITAPSRELDGTSPVDWTDYPNKSNGLDKAVQPGSSNGER